MSRLTWKCLDGRVLLIKDMEDSHLINTIKMLKRKGLDKDETGFMCAPPQGEMAYMAWEQEMADTIFHKRKSKSWDALVSEAKRRDLNAC